MCGAWKEGQDWFQFLPIVCREDSDHRKGKDVPAAYDRQGWLYQFYCLDHALPERKQQERERREAGLYPRHEWIAPEIIEEYERNNHEYKEETRKLNSFYAELEPAELLKSIESGLPPRFHPLLQKR